MKTTKYEREQFVIRMTRAKLFWENKRRAQRDLQKAQAWAIDKVLRAEKGKD